MRFIRRIRLQKTSYSSADSPKADTLLHKEKLNIHNEDPTRNATQPNVTKSRTLFLFLILFFLGGISMLLKGIAFNSKDLQEGIADDIIRFHVIANSDSAQDQNLKLIVRDELLHQLSPVLGETDSLEEARAILTNQIPDIEKLAEATLRENGYNYPVTVSLTESYFPLKVYGDYTFPPGYYDALRVQIGDAKGKNWWCVMYPPLCFVDETYSIVDSKSGKELKTLLSEEEYDAITNKKTPIKIKFKLLDSVKELFE